MPVTNLPSTADSGALPARVLGGLICLLGGGRGHGPLIQGVGGLCLRLLWCSLLMAHTVGTGHARDQSAQHR